MCGGAGQNPTTAVPTAGDLEPIALYEKREWMFRYKDVANPPPAWTQSTVDLMFSEDYVVLQSNTNVATLKQTLKGAGVLASVIHQSQKTGTTLGYNSGYEPRGDIGLRLVLDSARFKRLSPKRSDHMNFSIFGPFTVPRRDGLFDDSAAANKGSGGSSNKKYLGCLSRAAATFLLGVHQTLLWRVIDARKNNCGRTPAFFADALL